MNAKVIFLVFISLLLSCNVSKAITKKADYESFQSNDHFSLNTSQSDLLKNYLIKVYVDGEEIIVSDDKAVAILNERVPVIIKKIISAGVNPLELFKKY